MARIFLSILICCCILLSKANAQLVSVDIEEIQIRELYAVEYHSYTENPIGSATLYNPADTELWVNMVLDGEAYINAPVKMAAELPAGQRTQIPLYIDLDIGVLDLGRQIENVPVSIEMTAHLGSAEVDSDAIKRDIILHDKHKLPDDDPWKIAMFADPGDKYIMSEVSAGMGSTSEEKASAAFDLLQKKGIYCVGVGSNQIQYPRELLRTKFGSFYDCSILYAAILELLGVEAKLMFNSNVMLPFYKHQDDWYPVDVNMLSLNFEQARASGAHLQYTLSSQDSQTVILREAWRKYPPLKFPELDPEDMSLLRSADKLIEENRVEEAANVFHQLLEKYPDQSVLLNNAANVDLLMGKAQEAVEKYARAAALAPDDGGLYLNMGIAYYKLGDEEKSMESLGKAYTKLGSYVAMCRLLNLDPESKFYEEIDGLLRKSIRQTTEASTAALGARSLTKSQYPLYWKRFQ